MSRALAKVTTQTSNEQNKHSSNCAHRGFDRDLFLFLLPRPDEFNYGYQVERTNSQFQHKVKGPDDVTYGCYGYIDPVGEKHLVYYIADRLGYRLLAPDQPTKVFTDRVANSV